MLESIQADRTLSGLSSTSKVSLWRLFTYVVAYCAWTVEKLFDILKTEVNDIVLRMKPHTARWYAEKTLAFQYGFSLLQDSDAYSNTGFTDEQIATSKIIKYVAIVEQEKSLRVKVATENGDLQSLDEIQLAAFREYMSRIKDAGVRLQIESQPADKLRCSIAIYYDPLILDGNGQRLDGTNNEPVQTAVKNYLRNLPFNGSLVLAYLTDTLQQIEGVVIPHVVECSAQYGALPFTTIAVQYIPDAGYLRFADPSDLKVTFIPQSQIL